MLSDINLVVSTVPSDKIDHLQDLLDEFSRTISIYSNHGCSITHLIHARHAIDSYYLNEILPYVQVELNESSG